MECEDYLAKQEAQIALLAAKLRASSLYPAKDIKEPCDIAPAMIPVAYAMFEVLAQSCVGTGVENEWWSFLRGALYESIAKAESIAFESA